MPVGIEVKALPGARKGFYYGLPERPPKHRAGRRLARVLAAHEGTIRILHTLTPLGVAMAGPDVRDPYKD